MHVSGHLTVEYWKLEKKKTVDMEQGTSIQTNNKKAEKLNTSKDKPIKDSSQEGDPTNQ